MSFLDQYTGEARTKPRTPDELKFALTSLLLTYLQETKLSLTSLQDCLDVMQKTSSDFYRRKVVPYLKEKGNPPNEI